MAMSLRFLLRLSALTLLPMPGRAFIQGKHHVSAEALELRGVRAMPEAVPKLLFIGVNSATGHLDRRQEMRQTWMQNPAGKGLWQTRFLVGKTHPRDEELENALLHEQAEYQDIVRLDVPDTYDTLSNKTFHFLRAFSDGTIPNARFVMKLDDDTFPHVGRLVSLLGAEVSDFNYSYLGLFFDHGRVLRAGKNAETTSTYPKDVFPTYASGSGYILTAPLARHLSDSWETGRELRNEDANIGVLIDMAMRSGLKDQQVHFRSIPSTLYGCGKDDVLTMQIELGEMGCMWQRAMRNESNMCCPRSSLIQKEKSATRV